MHNKQSAIKIQPLVSICCTTYNQADYIKDAIEGFLMQEVSFPIEIIIRDDASTDGTSQIVKKYAEMYPEKIRFTLEDENTYSKGVSPMNTCMSLARGKYLALCEGDDYWTDPMKLQKQINFLETNEEYVLTSHKSKVIGPGGELTNEYFIYHTASLVFKCSPILDFLKSCKETGLSGDIFMKMFLSNYGKFKLFDVFGGVYRKTGKGTWTGRVRDENKGEERLAYHRKMIDFFEKSKMDRSLKRAKLEYIDARIQVFREAGFSSREFFKLLIDSVRSKKIKKIKAVMALIIKPEKSS